MKKIIIAVTILVAIAITESCRKHEVEQMIKAEKVIRQSHQNNARIQKV